MKLSDYLIDKSWTLFLDRDGVINRKLENDYVKQWTEFEFLPGVLEAIPLLNRVFGRVLIVTNQQGIGKGLMSKDALEAIHAKMLAQIAEHGGKIDRIYYCPHREEQHSNYRKPNIGMALHARKDFDELNLKKSFMLGDTLTDMHFGRKAGMKTVIITNDISIPRNNFFLIDFCYPSLLDFALEIENIIQ